MEDLFDNDYFDGTDLLGADPVYGPESPEDLAHANRQLTPAEQIAANEWKVGHPSFLQKQAFGGMKVWQVGLAGVGVVGVFSGVMIALFSRRK